VYTTVLLDGDATLANIVALREKLQQTGVNDEVVVYYGGMGILSKDFDYYLGNYEMDFRNPSVNGLSYESLRGLLAGIPARKRLLLIDACHSGEVDIDTSGLSMQPEVIGESTRGALVAKQAAGRPLPSVRYFQDNTRDGILQLSASQGNEFALESHQWKGGLFTYSLINALKNPKTDKDNNREISFDELYENVYEEVQRLSNNMQHAEARKTGTDLAIFRVPENGDKTPPKIMLLEPAMKTRSLRIVESDNDLVEIKGLVVDESELKFVSVNGQMLETEKDNTFKLSLGLKEGENNVIVTTEDVYGNQAVQQFQILGKAKPKQDLGNYHALVIGMERYTDSTLNLEHPVNDATKLVKILHTKYTFDSTNIIFLKNPKRSDIFDAFDQLKSIPESDNVLIFFAGHGEMLEGENQGYWLPADAIRGKDYSYVSNSDIKSKIKALKAKHILLVSDACFSGKLFARMRSVSDTISSSVVETGKMKCRRAITSGALATVPDKSIFMEYFCDYLKSSKDRYVFSRKLYTDIRTDVTNRSPVKQSPLEGTLDDTGDDNGDFIFIRR
jgi:uncharacterized caspase-like protein